MASWRLNPSCAIGFSATGPAPNFNGGSGLLYFNSATPPNSGPSTGTFLYSQSGAFTIWSSNDPSPVIVGGATGPTGPSITGATGANSQAAGITGSLQFNNGHGGFTGTTTILVSGQPGILLKNFPSDPGTLIGAQTGANSTMLFPTNNGAQGTILFSPLGNGKINWTSPPAAFGDYLFWNGTTWVAASTPRTFVRTTASNSPYSISGTQYELIGVTTTSTGPCQVNLPAASSVTAGTYYYITDEGGGAVVNNITVMAAGSDLIMGTGAFGLNANYSAVGLYSDGTSKWFAF